MTDLSPTLQIRVVSDEGGFDELENAWRALQAVSRGCSIFMTWECMRLWWKHYGAGRRLRILVAMDRERVVGLFALYLERMHKARGLLRMTQLRQVGIGGDTSPDDLGALLDPACETAVADRMAGFVLRELRGWDMLEFSDLPGESPMLAALLRQAPDSGVRLRRWESGPIVFGNLPASFDEYRQALSRNRRETMGRKRRKFEAQPGARLEVLVDESRLDAAFEQLVRLHLLRWGPRTAHPAFSSQEFRDYHREWMHVLLRQGRLRLLALEIGGNTVAMLYCMVYEGRLSFFQSGFDPACSQFSPGDVLMGRAVECAIAEGCQVFDMLKGDHDYKRHFFQQERRNVEMRAFRPGLIDFAYRAHEAWRNLRPRRAPSGHAAT